MESSLSLRLKMYLTLAMIFAVGSAVIYAVMFYLGFGFIFVIPITILFFLLQWYASPALLKYGLHLQYLKEGEMPELQQYVGEASRQAHIKAPKIAIAQLDQPNAFVFGRTPSSATLVIHKGLLSRINDRELRAVVSHELGHVKHSDMVVMAVVSFIPMLAWFVAQDMFWGSMFGGNRNGELPIIAIGMIAFLVYIISQLLILALSRARESFADRYSAESTGDPASLARALIKITSGQAAAPATQRSTGAGSSISRSLYIVDPFSARRDLEMMKKYREEIRELLPEFDIDSEINRAAGKRNIAGSAVLGLFGTHPSTYKRITSLALINRNIQSGKRQ